MRDVPICRMALEELALALPRILHALFQVDVLLAPVHHPDEAELERVNASGEYVEGVRAGVHKVELGENADGASSLRVDGPCKLECLGVGEIDVGCGDCEDDAAGETLVCEVDGQVSG